MLTLNFNSAFEVQERSVIKLFYKYLFQITVNTLVEHTPVTVLYCTLILTELIHSCYIITL